MFRPAPIQAQDDRARLRITPRHLAYLKVSEGCDRLCTFCAIPYMRGKHVTKPIEMVVAEAEELAGDGVRELVLVAQDMTYYGVDLYGRPGSPSCSASWTRSRGSTGSASSTATRSSSPMSCTTSWAVRRRSSRTWTCRCSTSTTGC